MKIVVGDKKLENAQAIVQIMNDAGFDAVPVEMDLSSRGSIMNLITVAGEYGEISMLVNAAGVSPGQAPIEAILHAYQIAKRCNEKRVMAEAVKWGKRSDGGADPETGG